MAWLEKSAATAELGNHPLGKPGWYANVHGYTTVPEEKCRWENHLRTIDIQYLVSGTEAIRWANVEQLGEPLCYIEEKERQEFAPPTGNLPLIHLRPGTFVIFMPGEAHCPKIALDTCTK